MDGRTESRDSRTLTECWLDGYEADLLVRLEWELDAGWRLVSPVDVVDNPVYGPGHPVRPVRIHMRARHLRLVA